MLMMRLFARAAQFINRLHRLSFSKGRDSEPSKAPAEARPPSEPQIEASQAPMEKAPSQEIEKEAGAGGWLVPIGLLVLIAIGYAVWRFVLPH